MTTAAVFWPMLLGTFFLVAGIIIYRRDARVAAPRAALRLIGLGPVFVAAGLAAFAGEHFTAAPTLAQLVPKWLPAPLFIAYFVGVAHLAAASSFVARRFIAWSAMCLAVMFALFVLLMDLPGALQQPGVRLAWSLAARETTYSIGALALFASVTRQRWPPFSATLATVARLWTAGVLVFYGIEHLIHPEFSPGVPDSMPTAAWVPFPTTVAYVTGLLLVACGVAMLIERHAASGAVACGWVLLFLTVVLYVPQLFLAHTVADQVNAINFIFDTMLFAGTVLVIGWAIGETAAAPVAVAYAA